jgi:hypothetical protein
MPSTPGTTLDASNNLLRGPIRDAWGTRAAAWTQIQLSGNAAMCGALPAWFTTRFGGAPGAMYNGARAACVRLCLHAGLCRERCSDPTTKPTLMFTNPRVAPNLRHAHARAVLAHRRGVCALCAPARQRDRAAAAALARAKRKCD